MGKRYASEVPGQVETKADVSAIAASTAGSLLGFIVVYFDEVDDPDSTSLKPRRWCLQREIAVSAIRHDRRKTPRWLCLGDGQWPWRCQKSRERTVPPQHVLPAENLIFVSVKAIANCHHPGRADNQRICYGWLDDWKC
jgi:hypothetical protein